MLNDHFNAIKKLLQTAKPDLFIDWFLAGKDQYTSPENVIIEFRPFTLNRGSGLQTEWRTEAQILLRLGSKIAVADADDPLMGVVDHNNLVKDVVRLMDGKNLLLSYLECYENLLGTTDDRMLINSLRLIRVNPATTIGNAIETQLMFNSYLVFSKERLGPLPTNIKPQVNVQ